MLLVGVNRSPYTRRVAITLKIQQAARYRAIWERASRGSLGERAVVPHTDGVTESRDEPRSKHRGETTMEYYAGIDVSLERSSVCVLDGSGKKVGKTTGRSFAGRIQELVKGHPNLEAIGEALLAVRGVLLHEFNVFEKRVRAMARSDARTKL